MIWEFFFGILIIYIILRLFLFKRTSLDIEIVRKHIDKIHVKMEVIDDIIYLWDSSTGDFLAQGKTLDDAIEVLKIRFPDTQFSMHKAN